MKFRIPKYVQKLLLKMSILVLIFSFCRIIFYIRNVAYFPEAGLGDFFVGMWFDLITTCLLFFPIIVFELFPNKNRKAVWYKWTLASLTGFVFFAGIFINLIDIEYFAFTSARSTRSLFTMLSFGSDLQDQIPSFVRDYWYIGLLIVAFFVGALLLLKLIYKRKDDSAETPIWKQSVVMVLFGLMAVFFGRGGPVHKPILPTQASKYTEPSNVQLVLNTAFTVIHSWSTETLEEKDYMSDEEALAFFNPIHQYGNSKQIDEQNICIIILESFSIEYINSLNVDNEDWTPFFDEMVDSSLVFDWAFANGKKSIDAVPSIISSIPKFMGDEYMLSGYSTNRIESLPEKLEELGYSTAFYHGASNGSMNFDAYCAMAGFDEYFGRNEYDNDDHFDGTWGIWDEEFLQWVVDRIGEMKRPFFSTIFTISSHPPYKLPEKYEQLFGGAKTEMQKVVQYTDMALRKFFEKAKKQPWFNNTLFILTADHTPSSKRQIYTHERGKMHIPLIFYHPTDTFFRGHNDRVVGHIDIMPTILDLLGYHQPFFSFGQSAFENSPGFTYSEIGGQKLFYKRVNNEPYTLVFENEKPKALYSFNNLYHDPNQLEELPKIQKSMSDHLKAIIQTYNKCLIRNQTTVDRFK